MPIYEFACDRCGARFERLVAVGTQSLACPECGSEETQRVLSAQSPTPRLVKTPAQNRRQERRNAELNASAKSSFKGAREKARRKAKGGSGGG